MPNWDFYHPNFRDVRLESGSAGEIDRIFAQGLTISCRMRERMENLANILSAHGTLLEELRTHLGIKDLDPNDLYLLPGRPDSHKLLCVTMAATVYRKYFGKAVEEWVQQTIRNLDVLVHIGDDGVGHRVFDRGAEQIHIPHAVSGQTYYVDRLLEGTQHNHYYVKNARLVK
jgi:citrate lyase gamma subunit